MQAILFYFGWNVIFNINVIGINVWLSSIVTMIYTKYMFYGENKLCYIDYDTLVYIYKHNYFFIAIDIYVITMNC